MNVFVPSRGFLFFYSRSSLPQSSDMVVFVPSRGFLFFYRYGIKHIAVPGSVFVPSRGFLFFYRCGICCNNSAGSGFRPLTGISLFLFYVEVMYQLKTMVFVPSRGFLFFYMLGDLEECFGKSVFVPSRGFLFFYGDKMAVIKRYLRFSSPHGDFSFSIYCGFVKGTVDRFRPLTGISLFLWMYDRTYDASDFVFVPSRGFLFFYWRLQNKQALNEVFVPSRGFLFFYPVCSFFHFLLVQQVFVPSRGFLFFYCMATFFYILTDPVFVPSRGFLFFYGVCENMKRASLSFSSPHGDFSFSMAEVHVISKEDMSFRPLTGISLFLSYLIFPL